MASKSKEISEMQSRFRQEVVEEPQAVVVLLGWLGSVDKYVSKYASALYSPLGCSSVRTTVAGWDMYFNWENCALTLEAGIGLAESIAPEVPIIVHVFSNGGCSCVSGLLAKAAREGQESSAAAALRRVAAWVFDSCPAYLHTSTGAGAVAEGFGNSVAKSLAYGAMYAVLWSATLFAPTVAEDFWRPLTDNPLEAPQLYLYSQTDHLTLTSDLEPLIAARRERGHTVHALCFQDSPHVSHLRSYPGIYTAAVRAVVNQASNSASSTPETFAASLAELSGLPGVAPLHLEGAEGAAAAAANTGLWSTNSKGTQQLSARVLETVQDLPVAFSGRVCQSPPADAADAKM